LTIWKIDLIVLLLYSQMKTIIAIKLFLVLCCQTVSDGQYKYEVKNLQDTTQTGVIFSNKQYFEGDTIKLKTY